MYLPFVYVQCMHKWILIETGTSYAMMVLKNYNFNKTVQLHHDPRNVHVDILNYVGSLKNVGSSRIE